MEQSGVHRRTNHLQSCFSEIKNYIYESVLHISEVRKRDILDMSQALEHWLLLFPATFSAFITPFLYYKHILDIPWHTTVAKPLAFNTYNKMSNAIWLHFIPLILYFMFLSLFLVPIHTHTHIPVHAQEWILCGLPKPGSEVDSWCFNSVQAGRQGQEKHSPHGQIGSAQHLTAGGTYTGWCQWAMRHGRGTRCKQSKHRPRTKLAISLYYDSSSSINI